jgi:prolyl-tRNA editing enzyme YbaK/EbsC (Cys-tRNA(Pro) deacylase)
VRGVTLASGAKAMLLKDSGKKLSKENTPYYMAIMSASDRFSSKQFKKVISCKNFRFASPEELYQVTNVLTGALAPFGKMFNIPVFVDRGLSRQ